MFFFKCIGPGIITVRHTTIHALYNIQQLSKDLPLSMQARQHVQQSSDNAFFVHRADKVHEQEPQHNVSHNHDPT